MALQYTQRIAPKINMNNMAPRTFWFYLKPFIYPVVKGEKTLLLNTMDKYAVIEQDGVVASLLQKWMDRSSFGVVEVSSDSEEYLRCSQFFSKMEYHAMGGLADKAHVSHKPLQITPFQYKMLSPATGTGLHSSNEVTLYINSSCTRNCTWCDSYCDQLRCCTKRSDSGAVMDLDLIRNFIRNTDKSVTLNVCGGNITMHPQFDTVVELLRLSGLHCVYHLHYRNFNADVEKKIGAPIVVSIDFPLGEELYLPHRENITYQYIITSKDDLEQCEACVRKHAPEHFFLAAFHTGTNQDFFENYVFLQQKNMLCGAGELHSMVRNKILNRIYFSQTLIFPNGDVRIATDGDVLGNLYTHPYKNIREKVIHHHNVQLVETQNGETCRDCLFAGICPLSHKYIAHMS